MYGRDPRRRHHDQRHHGPDEDALEEAEVEHADEGDHAHDELALAEPPDARERFTFTRPAIATRMIAASTGCGGRAWPRQEDGR